MKKVLLTQLVMIASVFFAIGQTADNRWAIPLGVNISHVVRSGDPGFFDKNLPGLETGLKYYLSPSLNLAGNFNLVDLEDNDFNVVGPDVDASLEYKFANGKLLSEESLFKPYLTAGLGAVPIDEGKTFFEIPAGAGVRSVLKDNVDWYVQSRYKYVPDGGSAMYSYITSSVGLVVTLGSKKDADGDGVLDRNDTCPTEAGSLATNGCPDSDNDGIADKDDACPQLAGIPKFNGCPDTDGDGVIDIEDACPKVAGLASLKGCPDADGDGVPDSKDECPNTAGDKNGCPDSDNDGIVDKDDECPNEYGLSSDGGCPKKDADNDGIIDEEDACPNVAGVEANKGCPEIEEEVAEVLRQALEGVQFRSGSEVLTRSSYDKLDKVVEVMNSHPEFKLRISGYTDNTGNADSNLALSKKRAHAAEKYIVDKGIEQSRVSAEGYGIANPIADNSTPEGRAKNRRVEFKVVFE